MLAFNKVGAAAAAKALSDADAAATADRIKSIVTTGIITAGIVAGIIIVVMMIRRRSRQEEPTELLSDILNAQTIPMQLPGIPAAQQLTANPFAPGDSDQKRADIEAFAERDPQRTAEFLRGLMDEKQPA